MEADYVALESKYRCVNEISTRRILKLEKKLVHRADHILTCSGMDAKRISELYGIKKEKKFTTIQNGIHFKKTPHRFDKKDLRGIFPELYKFVSIAIFSGSDVEHNRSAVRFILESIAPKLSQECAFILKGQCIKLFRNQSNKNVFMDPAPGSIEPYANICTVALNPIFHGSGTSLKVLDYLANGLSVISTEFGMRGYEDLKTFVTLSEPNDFVRKISENSKFLSAPQDAMNIYSWESAITTLENTYFS